MWTNNDFQILYAFMAEIDNMLDECPDRIQKHADVLLDDCRAARQALTRIADSLSERQASEAEIHATLDYGKTAEQHLRG